MAAARDSFEIESEHNKCDCVVCALLMKGFSTLSFAEKLKIITKGRAKPPMTNLATKMKNCTRHFYPEKSYEQFKWLTGCGKQSKLFCWPCLLFENDRGLWNKGGFADLNNFHKAVKRHYTSQAHLQNVVKEKLFGKTRMDYAINAQLKNSHPQHNSVMDKNRVILKRLIDVVCFLGPVEGSESFQALIDLLAKYDDCLKNHLLGQSSVLRGTLHQTQNDLTSAVATVILKRIKHEIRNARFIAIILDDVANSGQLSAVVRYVKTDGTVQERFLGFYNNVKDRTADALYMTVCDIIREVDGGKKLVAQSYDGSIVMSRDLGRLQAKVRNTFPSALFANCYKSNLVLSQSLSHNIGECKGFFAALSGMADFFSQSKQHSQVLNALVRKRISWNYSGALVSTVAEHRESLSELFENIIENCEKWDADTLNSARGFLSCLKRDFGFNFLLNVFSEIFPFSDEVFDVLQTKINDIGLCLNKVNEFKSLLEQKRTEFDLFWEKTLKTMKGDTKATYNKFQTSFFDIIDQIIEQINYRFSNLSDFKFLELCNFNAYKTKPFPQEAFKSLLFCYGTYFDKELLRSELTVIYKTDDINTKNDANELMQFLKDIELDDAYTEVLKLCELALTIPVTSSSESSTLKRVKISMGPPQMSLLSIEHQLLQDLLEERGFYDDVIEEFAKTTEELNYITNRFPTNLERRKIWFSLVGINENQRLPKHPEICSSHFNPDDIIQRENGLRFVKPGADPKLIDFEETAYSTTATPKPKKAETPDRPDFVNIQMLHEANEEAEAEESDIKIEMDEMDIEEAALQSITKEESDKDETNGEATPSTSSRIEEPAQESSSSTATTAPRHPLQIFFDSMAHTAMGFPPPLAIRAKMEVLEVISKLELEMWNQSE